MALTAHTYAAALPLEEEGRDFTLFSFFEEEPPARRFLRAFFVPFTSF